MVNTSFDHFALDIYTRKHDKNTKEQHYIFLQCDQLFPVVGSKHVYVLIFFYLFT